jgi:hypothetical protein
MSGPLQAISPECCLEIAELALPELVSPMRVPASKACQLTAFGLGTQPHGSDHVPPSFMQAISKKRKEEKEK